LNNDFNCVNQKNQWLKSEIDSVSIKYSQLQTRHLEVQNSLKCDEAGLTAKLDAIPRRVLGDITNQVVFSSNHRPPLFHLQSIRGLLKALVRFLKTRSPMNIRVLLLIGSHKMFWICYLI
jgi:hypothetical protein